MHTVLLIIFVIVAVLLGALVLMHSGKDAGLSGAFGTGGPTGGSSAVAEKNLTRITVVVAVIFAVVCVLLARGL